LKAGDSLVELTVDLHSVLKDAKGGVVALSKLRKGGKVKVAYRLIGKYDVARTVAITG